MRRRAILFALGALMTTGTTGAEALAQYRWRKRLVLVFAPDPRNSLLLRQRRELEEIEGASDNRDLLLIEVAADRVTPASAGAAEPLRRRFGVAPGAFAALLIGKDGGVKLRSGAPLSARQLASTIDAMPMRREEMRRGGAHGK